VFCAIDIVIVKHIGYLTLLDRCPAAAVNIGDMLQKCYPRLLFLLFSMRHYAVNWCNELRFCIFAAPTCNCCNLQV